jgi:TolB-like protein
MKNIRKLLLATTTLAVLVSAGLTPALSFAADEVKTASTEKVAKADAGYTVAILPFSYSTKDKAFEDMGSETQQLMTAYLSANPSVMLVERAEVDKALSEVELGKSGMVDPETAAKVGYLTGAQILVTGRIFPVKNDIILVAKIIGIETGRVFGTTVTFSANDKITTAAQDLSEKVGTTITEKADTMVAKADNQKSVIAKLKPKVEGMKLPSISIEIAERNINHDVNRTNSETGAIRPAAETEMGFILKQLGFEVVDIAESNRHADIEVSGDSFSEFALRKGNLVSAKGRVEIKAINKADGKVLVVDRDNGVAVDLAPDTAGKAAIAKSAEVLTERLVEAILQNLKK